MNRDDQLVQEWFLRHRPPVGERLPAERVLAETLGLSRAALRKGLAGLEAQGLLLRQVGRGTFVQSPVGAEGRIFDPIGTPGVDASPRQVMAARLVLEPSLARIAARDGNREGHRGVEQAETDVADATDWAGYDRADANFHRSIALATGNPVLVRLFDETAATADAISWGRLRQRDETGFARPDPALRDHAAIGAAIRMRDVHEAGDAMTRHLQVEAAILVGELA